MAGIKSPSFTTALHVITDPTFAMPAIPMPAWPDTGDSAAPPVGNKAGVLEPVVWLNKRILFPRNIKSIHIDFTGRYPEGTLTITDSSQRIAESDTPSPNNRILIAISPATDDAYKKIKIPGYITDTFPGGPGETVYNFIYKYLPLEIPQMMAYPRSNTFNFFKRIADASHLGFAVSEEVQDIDDLHYRVFFGGSLKQAMEDQVRFAGLDEKSVFDYWVDPWGYINLVNLAYLTSDVDMNVDLKFESGHSSDVQDIPSSIETTELGNANGPRPGPTAFITNLQMREETNIHIAFYKQVSDNNATVFKGNSVQTQQFTAEGAEKEEGQCNTVEQQDILTTAPQLEAMDASQYEFAKYKFQGVEMDDTPILKQQGIHDNFMNKFSQGFLEVTMSKPNFGLTRGGQIQVLIYDYAQRYTQLTEDDPDQLIDEKQQTPVLDPTLTGCYYIHGMMFDFVNGQKFLRQTLKLIRVTPQVSAADLIPDNIKEEFGITETVQTGAATSVDAAPLAEINEDDV